MFEPIIFVIVALLALFGSLTQIYPGNGVLVVGVLLWAFEIGGQAWWWFGGISLLVLISMVVKYLLPAKYMKREGVSNRTLLIGALFGIVGFFVIPFVGLFIGFPIGVYVAELANGRETAWPKTVIAVKGVGATIALEVLATAIALAIWALAMFVL